MTAYGNNDDATVLIPRPGAKADPKNGSPPTEKQPGADATAINPARHQPRRLSFSPSIGVNPILDAASTLLSLVSQLRTLEQHHDIELLHGQCVEMIREFEQQLRRAELPPETIQSARYALCALIDETVLHTPWGNESTWGTHTLVTTFQNETVGGERFFQLLNECQQTPVKHLDLLELFYICLSLGFQGKLRLESNGRDRIETIRSELYHIIRHQRDLESRKLAPSAENNVIRNGDLGGKLPLWVGCSMALALMLCTYLGFNYAINKHSEAAFNTISQLVPDAIATRDPGASPGAATTRHLQQLLAMEIQKHLLSVVQYPDHTTIRIQSDNLFQSGSASADEAYLPILQKLGQALSTVKGRIVVAGYTDNQPIFTARYPSNWHLSLARANTVVDVLSHSAQLGGRLIAEGKGAVNPLVANDTPAHRAENRRVDINVYP